MRFGYSLLPIAVIASAIVFSLYLQCTLVDEVFWCGDSGLKALMTRQFAAGEIHADLRLPAEPWVRTLWNDGLYPFDPPFVYEIAGRHYIQYPLAFPLVSALPYRALGWRGLYVIPLLSTWLLWGACLVVCRRWGWGAPETAAALAALAFASPLTFYSATYWEHAPAVGLAFVGLMPMLTPDLSTGRAGLVVHGFAFGLALWLREELFAVLGNLLGLALVARVTGCAAWLPLRRSGAWFAGALSAVGGLLVTNAMVYGQPLGAHAFAVLRYPEFSRLGNTLALWRILPGLLVTGFPVALVACIVPFVSRGDQTSVSDAPLRFLLVVCVLAIVSIPLLLPDVRLSGAGGKQWGPRFLLVVVPLLCLLAGQVVRYARMANGRPLRVGLVAAFLLAFTFSVRVNCLQAAAALSRDYGRRVLPSVAFLRGDGASTVAVTHQFIAQDLMPALTEKRFFHLRDMTHIGLLADALHARGEREFVYVSYSDLVPARVTTASGHVVHIVPIGEYDAYTIARASW